MPFVPLDRATLDTLLDRYLRGGIQGQQLADEVGYSQGYLSAQMRRRAVERGLYSEYRAAVRAIYRSRAARVHHEGRHRNPPRAEGPWGD